MIDCVEIILLGRVVPDSCIDDDPGSIGHAGIRDAHLTGRMGHEVIGRQLRQLDKLEPLASHSAADGETARGRAAECNSGSRAALGCALQADLALMRTRSGDDPDPAGIIRLGNDLGSIRRDLQILGLAVNLGGHIIGIFFGPVEAPHGDIRVIGHKQLIRVVGCAHDGQCFGLEGCGAGAAAAGAAAAGAAA